MNVYAIIAEYNPFHRGHVYQLNKIKSLDPSSTSLVLMSGAFCQRGEPAILDKFQRAKDAVEKGADIVFEYPVSFVLQGGPFFAEGAVKILDSLEIVDYLAFGTEDMDTRDLEEILEIMEGKDFKDYYKNLMDKGRSSAFSIRESLGHFFPGGEDLLGPNNSLALSYMRSLKDIKSKIRPLAIKRKGSHHHDLYPSSDTPSAGYLRKMAYSSDFSYLEDHISPSSLKFLKEERLPLMSDYYDLIKYKFLIEKNDFSNNPNYEEGLDENIKKALLDTKNVEDFLDRAASQRYTKSRIRRFIFSSLLDIKKHEKVPKSIRPLAFNKRGRKLLKDIKSREKIKIINKFSSIEGLSDDREIYEACLRAENLRRFRSLDYNTDYCQSPIYIDK